MTKTIFESIIYISLVCPIVLITLKNRKFETLKILLIFSVYFILNRTLLYLPLKFEELRIFAGNWNWTGKIFAVLGSVIFLMIYRKFTLSDYHLTFHQNKGFFRKGVLIIVLILVVQSIFSLIINTSKDWNTETFFFQLTMPGIDEELAFRGIMLGLLIKILKPSSKTIFHPAILVTFILFGLVHGLFLNESYEPTFRSYPFFNTMILGIIWAWITMKSGSILLALVSHNLANVVIQLIRII